MQDIAHSLDTPYSEVWYDFMNDTLKVKVYRLREKDGHVYKEGVVFSFTQELLFRVVEGMEYPVKNIEAEKLSKFSEMLEEINNE